MKSKKWILPLTAVMFFAGSFSVSADEIDQAEQSTTEDAKKPGYLAVVKEKYQLTDEQVKAMQDKGLQANQMAIVSQLAQTSGKTTAEVTTLRVDQKMGWGAIAKQLGVAPREIGQSIASLHRSDRVTERLNARSERKAQAKDARMERKAERKENKKGKGH